MVDSWQKTNLGDILKERAETPDSRQIETGAIPIISKIRFATGEIEFRNTTTTKTKMILVRPGDLVISGINAIRGAIGLYSPDHPRPAAATIHYSAYQINEIITSTQYVWWLLRSQFFQSVLEEQVPQGIKTELKPKRLLSISVPLPPLTEQRRIITRIKAIEQRLKLVEDLQTETDANLHGLLVSAYKRIMEGVSSQPMEEVAPLIRRKVEIDPDIAYPELGIRSFGRGTFHKPAIPGSELGNKRLYQIKAGDLLFSNVFSWEGAVAVAQPEDDGRYGSHRFITRLPEPGIVTAKFLCFHFLTEEGLRQLQDASPGSAGRNRTLSLKALDAIQVPVPPIQAQLWFNALYDKAQALRQWQEKVNQEAKAIMPSVLDKAFRGEL